MNQRIEFALRALGAENFRALCREYGISPRVGYKWRRRFLERGMEGMGEESRRPKSSPGKLGEEEVCRIVRIKERHRAWGPRKIREVYNRRWGGAPSESSFKRVLDHAGLVVRRRVRAGERCGRIAAGRKAQGCNEVWTVDFKGWWRDAKGKCEPLTVRDEFSRYILELRDLADATTQSVRGCFQRLFEIHGMPLVIRSDNGPPFACRQGVLGLTRLSAWWLSLGIDLERGRPGCPQDNAAHERLHLDIQRELAGACPADRQASFEVWRAQYNEERPHEALGMRPPAEIYTPSERRWEGTPHELLYAGMLRRKVHALGHVHLEGERVRISSAVGGWHVGLAARQDGDFDVYFARLLLGRLDRVAGALIPASGAEYQQMHAEGR